MADHYVSTHAAARQFGEEVPTSLCGKMARGGTNLSADWGKITCWHCRHILKSRLARCEVAHD